MARFSQYALEAAEEALGDAEWKPKAENDLEATVGSLKHHCGFSELISKQGVCLGSGIGSLEDAYDTSVAFEAGVSTKYRKRIWTSRFHPT
jgi:3-oxoacyl-[acyl-carrier-protein] synthase II